MNTSVKRRVLAVPDKIVVRSDLKMSADRLLERGAAAYRDNNLEYAQLCFGFARQLFDQVGDAWNSQVAADWQRSAITRSANEEERTHALAG